MSSFDGNVECFQLLRGASLLVRAPNFMTPFGMLAPLSTNHREKPSIEGTQETLPNKDHSEYKSYFARAWTQYLVKSY